MSSSMRVVFVKRALAGWFSRPTMNKEAHRVSMIVAFIRTSTTSTSIQLFLCLLLVCFVNVFYPFLLQMCVWSVCKTTQPALPAYLNAARLPLIMEVHSQAACCWQICKQLIELFNPTRRMCDRTVFPTCILFLAMGSSCDLQSCH